MDLQTLKTARRSLARKLARLALQTPIPEYIPYYESRSRHSHKLRIYTVKPLYNLYGDITQQLDRLERGLCEITQREGN